MRSRLRRAAAVTMIVIAVLGLAGYAAYRAIEKMTAAPPPAPGCTAAGASLDPEQAGIAATIAGVAARHGLPERAVTIAYATALQESGLQDLSYGDRDSVGVFQQRPSQGWGTTAQIENPIYATTRFFSALVKIPRYATIPVYQAAQEVQHSADGSAYDQYSYLGGLLADAFTGKRPHAVTCWYVRVTGIKPDLTAASAGLRAAFGTAAHATVSRHSLKVRARRGAGWTAASWLVAHAQQYQLSTVRYAGYEWKAADGTMGWHHDPDPASGSIVAG